MATPSTPPTTAPELVPPPPSPHPAVGLERVASLDVLRGFALLGILLPNLFFFGWPQQGMPDAEAMGRIAQMVHPEAIAHDAANEVGFTVMALGFMGKFMFLFATLFGAGVFFFDRKFHRAGERVPLSRGAKLWYTRTGWLLVIGLCHAFFMWYGDILVWYAVAAMGLIWWMRRLNAWVLLAIAAVLYLIGTGGLVGLGALMDWALREGHLPPEMSHADPMGEVLVMRGASVLEMFKLRAISLAQWYPIMPFTFFWQVSGLMLGGLALAKMGVYTGKRSAKFYALMGLLGIPVGYALTIAAYGVLESFELEPLIEGMYAMSITQLVGIPTALGYAGIVLLVVKKGWLRPLTTGLAAVGRTALTSYLLQTLICTTLFYGHGGGLFGEVQFPALWGVMGGVWAVNIVFSMVWLRFFRFGPVEWVWRSLTYWKVQGMRKEETER